MVVKTPMRRIERKVSNLNSDRRKNISLIGEVYLPKKGTIPKIIIL
jgi:hypothetical protein